MKTHTPAYRTFLHNMHAAPRAQHLLVKTKRSELNDAWLEAKSRLAQANEENKEAWDALQQNIESMVHDGTRKLNEMRTQVQAMDQTLDDMLNKDH